MGELVITNVDKIYRPSRKAPVHAVQSLSLTVKPGEITACLALLAAARPRRSA
jgi:ABC-type glutathione transport system ATPase component